MFDVAVSPKAVYLKFELLPLDLADFVELSRKPTIEGKVALVNLTLVFEGVLRALHHLHLQHHGHGNLKVGCISFRLKLCSGRKRQAPTSVCAVATSGNTGALAAALQSSKLEFFVW